MATTGSLRSETLLEQAAAGRLPDWARVGEARRAHIARVAELMDGWPVAPKLDERDRRRSRAAAWPHDLVRDAPPAELLPHAGCQLAGLPGKVLHRPG